MPLPPAQPLKKVTLHAIIGLTFLHCTGLGSSKARQRSPKNVAWLFASSLVGCFRVFGYACFCVAGGVACIYGVWSVYVGHRSNRDKLIACCNKSDHYFQHITNKYGHH
jgi:hypothetical protein